jgi:hypothetical protein
VLQVYLEERGSTEKRDDQQDLWSLGVV